MKTRRWETKLKPGDHPKFHTKLRFGYHFMGLNPLIHAYITYIFMWVFQCLCLCMCVYVITSLTCYT